LSPAHNPVLLENQYLTGLHSAKDPNISTYKIYIYLPHDIDHKPTILTILSNQLVQMQTAGHPKSPEGMDALQVQENSTYPVCPELDDKPITSTTEVIPTQFRICPYSFTLTLPTFNSASYGLLLLASKQARWSSNIPEALIPQTISQPIRQALIQQMPTTIRSNTKAQKLARDIWCITSLAFTSHRATECYRIFKAYALYTAYKIITSAEYRYQHERAASAAELSPPFKPYYRS
jgi:hypothetical protein